MNERDADVPAEQPEPADEHPAPEAEPTSATDSDDGTLDGAGDSAAGGADETADGTDKAVGAVDAEDSEAETEAETEAGEPTAEGADGVEDAAGGDAEDAEVSDEPEDTDEPQADAEDVDEAEDVDDAVSSDDVEDPDEPQAEDAQAEDAEEDEQGVEQGAEVAAAVSERAGRGQRRGAHARRVTPRERLRALIAPQANRTQALIALACLVVGFGLSVQVKSTSQESSFDSLRQSELVGLLDRLNKRQEDLRKEVTRLEQEKAALESEDSEAARRAAQDRQHTLAILAGTEPATGPGIELVISDPKGGVNASDMLNAVQELRDAGAEVIQIGPARVTVDTYFLDADDGIVVDGERLTAPYRIKAIGDPHTMRTAMDIPGGVLESLHRAGAEGRVSSSRSMAVTAVKES